MNLNNNNNRLSKVIELSANRMLSAPINARASFERENREYCLFPGQITAKLKEQHGKCTICLCPINISDAKVDHNHKTGALRDLLCHNCNILLGHAFENVEILQRAIGYLQKHKTKVVWPSASPFKTRKPRNPLPVEEIAELQSLEQWRQGLFHLRQA